MSDHTSAIRNFRHWDPDPLLRQTIDTIHKHGWAVTAVGDVCEQCAAESCGPGTCAFAYTSGLSLHGIPELAVYGLDAQASCQLLNELGTHLHRHDWHDIIDSARVIEVESFGVGFRMIEIIDNSDLLITNALFPNTPALQAVWPDEAGVYPWDDDYALEPQEQELKGIVNSGAARVRRRHTITGFSRAERRRASRRRGKF